MLCIVYYCMALCSCVTGRNAKPLVGVRNGMVKTDLLLLPRAVDKE